jgi:hypothetical protein
MAIKQIHAIPIIVDEWLGYHMAMDMLFLAIWKHFPPTFPLVLGAWPLFFKKVGDI